MSTMIIHVALGGTVEPISIAQRNFLTRAYLPMRLKQDGALV